MRLKISHRTRYSYDAPVPYALQRVRLVPLGGATQTVHSWTVSIEGAREELRFHDHFGNDTRLISVSGEPHEISIVASGEIETRDTSGVAGAHTGFAPLWLFQQETGLTSAGSLARDLTSTSSGASEIETLHGLSAAIRARVDYVIGVTDAGTSAEEALALGRGVCQDHAHIFLAAARALGFPARYVSGYLMLDDATDQVATHAWAEAHIDGLGWVGFDVSNGISPDERYVRIATGRDYRDAMPTSGIRLGSAQEALAVHITVEQ
ncbi:transglutaminase family protein [Aquamicrobium sp. LC103]|uniref:transglutaminase family protein n=1 Tax=Aquamicrobium sp. LC103 TaxID=1120658 RepID=UPI00063EC1F8|nr:transglutaminase family protein [Aquamicrobium sp. LC103]TKT79312.1 transglutaminase family protein [Aquamicrobium sp. LC103]